MTENTTAVKIIFIWRNENFSALTDSTLSFNFNIFLMEMFPIIFCHWVMNSKLEYRCIESQYMQYALMTYEMQFSDRSLNVLRNTYYLCLVEVQCFISM